MGEVFGKCGGPKIDREPEHRVGRTDVGGVNQDQQSPESQSELTSVCEMEDDGGNHL